VIYWANLFYDFFVYISFFCLNFMTARMKFKQKPGLVIILKTIFFFFSFTKEITFEGNLYVAKLKFYKLID
jgi:hypothetical protein